MLKKLIVKLYGTCYSLRNYNRLVIIMDPTALVANTVIKRSLEKGYEITSVKLQKLVYFLFKRYLQVNKRLLFKEPFEVWEKGPVVPSIYEKFSSGSRGKRIEQYKQDGSIFIVNPDNLDFYKALDFVILTYGDWSAEELSEATHVEGGAWHLALKKNNRYIFVEDIANERWVINKEELGDLPVEDLSESEWSDA